MDKIKVFYLDDEEELLSIFKETFESETVEITVFSEANALIPAVHERLPDLIFLDYRLPSTTGQEVAMQLPQDIPKVLITGDLNIGNLRGFQKVLNKPFSMDEIQKILDHHLQSKTGP